MAVHLQDEQEIANFKYFWQRFGRWIFGILLILALAYLGWVIYQSHAQKNNEKAAVIFDTFVTEASAGHEVDSKKALMTLQQDYPKTINAAQATLMMAGTAFDQGKYDEAVKHLKWVQEKQSGDLMQTITAQRLAVVYMQQKKYPEALKALDVQVAAGFQAILLDTKGDVFLALNENKLAIEAYKSALKDVSANSALSKILQMKLDTLSET